MLKSKCSWNPWENSDLDTAEEVASAISGSCDVSALKKRCDWTSSTPATMLDATRIYGDIPCSATGLTWKCVAADASHTPSGNRLQNEVLIGELERGVREFEPDVWKAMRVRGTTLNSYVQLSDKQVCFPYAKKVCSLSGMCVDSDEYRLASNADAMAMAVERTKQSADAADDSATRALDAATMASDARDRAESSSTSAMDALGRASAAETRASEAVTLATNALNKSSAAVETSEAVSLKVDAVDQTLQQNLSWWDALLPP